MLSSLQDKRNFIFFVIYLFFFNSFALQLGDGTTENQLFPKCVLTDVESVYATDVYSVVLKKDLSVWATGLYAQPFPYMKSECSECNSFIKIKDSVKKIFSNINILLENDTLLHPDSKSMYFSDIFFAETAKNVTYFYEKDYVCAFISKDKSLWMYGAELRDIEISEYSMDYIYYPFSEKIKKVDDNVLDVISKNNILIYLKEDGTVWGMGSNYQGRLSKSQEKVIPKPIKIAESISKIYVNDYVFLITNKNDLVKIENGEASFIDSDIKEISDFFYIKNNGQLFAFGFSSYGALGIGDTEGYLVQPRYVMDNVKKAKGTEFHSLILTHDNKLFSCGGGWCNFGCLGDGTRQKRDTPVLIMDDVKDFDISNYHSMVIKNDDSLWAFGLNNTNEYELGL
ncbi:hypothetical protein [Treponema sp. Marseille-Q3903]|uniref:hypothetical protein n=1 Tax=Treponema sp. Marseille-Q3903 TaxID=2766703 RepID=UPI0016528DCA|nr:hypothetical protein [Treponema sp. Marseille-Q3903]MBC6712413.1 hypothetical protein [Treponema sp. Marseille-Q3903]